MRLLFRVMALLVVVPATYYFIYWVPFSLIPFIAQRWIPRIIISLLCAAGMGWYVWKKLGSDRFAGFRLDFQQTPLAGAGVLLYDLDRFLLLFLAEDRRASAAGLIVKTPTALVFPVIEPHTDRITVDFVDVGNLVYAVTPRAK